MGGVCNVHRRDERFIQNYGLKTRREETTRGRPRRKWVDNIRMNLRKIG